MSGYNWLPPYGKLDSEQRAALGLLESGKDGLPPRNFWIQGFAGSGKSIVLAWAAIRYRERAPAARAQVVVFTRALKDLFEAAIHKNSQGPIPVSTVYGFKKDTARPTIVYVDEVQDLTPEELDTLNHRADHVVVAGDRAQSIYPYKVKPDAIDKILNCGAVKLSIIHRITRTIFNIAEHFGEIIAPKDSIELDVEVPLWHAQNENDEVEFVWQQAKIVAAQPEPTAILLPSGDMIIDFCNAVLRGMGAPTWKKVVTTFPNGGQATNWGSLNGHLERHGVDLEYLGSGAGSVSDLLNGRTRIMTYNSAKGLDFKTVFLPRLSRQTRIWSEEELARTLFFVALTRSRQNLHLSYAGPGEAHHFVEEIRGHLIPRECTGVTGPSTDDDYSPVF
jgi:hypothetical protein